MDVLLILFFCIGLPVLFLAGPVLVLIGVIRGLVGITKAIFPNSTHNNHYKDKPSSYAGPESSKKVNISPPSNKQNPVSEYLFQSSVKGIPYSEAINRLLANGWSQEQINEAQVSNEASSPISLSTDP